MSKKKKVTGRITIHRKGFGFVIPEAVGAEDIFIPAGELKGAIDGDLVEAIVTGKSHKGLEGVVSKVLQIGRRIIVGAVTLVLKNGDAVIFSSMVGEERGVLLKKEEGVHVKVGDRVALKVVKSANNVVVCKFHESYGNISNALLDSKVAIEEHQIKHEFPEEAIAEAKSFDKDCPVVKNRTDLTHLETFTIDPINARDYDDALSIEKTPEGTYHLGVHIADVSHYVKEGSALDLEAFKRGNSTYFVDRVVPMLPEELSNELCSLKEHVNRYTMSVLMEYSSSGELLHYKICRGVIHSRKRFTYEEAKRVLDGEIQSPHLKSLELLVELCGHLKKIKRERGCIELAMPELRLKMGDDGVPVGEEWVEYDITHQLVEEYMLAANEIVATHIIQEGRQCVFRIHEQPEREHIEEFCLFANLLGYKLPKDPTEKDIQEVFQQAIDSPLLNQLAVKYIRSMKWAVYSKDNVGHYGLALQNYTHFTSPIRRYIDLVVHRLLFQKKYKPNLEIIAKQCTETERKSMKAEMSVLRLKKLRYIQRILEKRSDKTFKASITKIKPNGISFNVDFINLEGFLHISSLGDDYYIFNEKKSLLSGESTHETFQIGQQIEVGVESIDLIHQDCKWILI